MLYADEEPGGGNGTTEKEKKNRRRHVRLGSKIASNEKRTRKIQTMGVVLANESSTSLGYCSSSESGNYY